MKGRHRTIVASAVGIALLVAGCDLSVRPYPGGGGGGGQPGTGITPAPAGKPPFPQVGAYVGASSSLQDGAQTRAQRIALMDQRDADAGRPYDIAHTFYHWSKPFPGYAEYEAIEHDRIPMISWNGTDTGAITSGQHDDLIRTRARAVRDLEVPVFLRFFWEMDGHKGRTLAGGDPARFIAAWRHVHGIFREEGATNAAWVWAPTNLRFGGPYGTSGPTWYPGDDVVDWIGADGYNWAPAFEGAPYESFESVFANWYAWAAQHDKPLMVAETGVLERKPGEKAAWFRDMLETLKSTYPRIKAVVYFDLAYGEGASQVMHWPVDTTPESYAAWNHVINDPYLNTR